MKIAIIGTGNVGGALATQLAKAGHQIFLGVQDIHSFKGKYLLENPNTSVHSVSESAENAEVILVAAIPEATQIIAKEIKSFVKGKTLIDAMNSIQTRPKDFNNSFEAFRYFLPETLIVKCFNTTGFENMANPIYDNEGIDMFVASSSVEGKKIAEKLALDIGFATVWDFGGDDKVQLLEHFAMSWINLAIIQGHGRNMAFRVLKREIY